MATDEPRPAGTLLGAGDLRRLRGPTAERAASQPRESLLPGAAWFVGVAAAAMVGGWWLVYVAQIFVGDAMARVVQADAVVLSRDPHLAAVGFVWPPLPSIAEVPFVLLIERFTAPRLRFGNASRGDSQYGTAVYILLTYTLGLPVRLRARTQLAWRICEWPLQRMSSPPWRWRGSPLLDISSDASTL